MKIFFISLIILSLNIFIQSKKDIEILEDFTAEIEYRLENSDSAWIKRGVINFLQKGNNKHHKSSVSVNNEPLTAEERGAIKTECLASGLYLIRVKTNNKTFYSSVNSCVLEKNSFRDRFIINYFGSIKSDQIISINYDVDVINTQGVEKKKNFSSSVDFVNSIPSIGPNFPEEREEDKKQPQAEPSFLQKYWWVILIILLLSSLKAPAEEGAQSAQ